jgi:diguanylate cyclase (GGDEF)-like protein
VLTFFKTLLTYIVIILASSALSTEVKSDYYGEPYFDLVGNSRSLGESSTAIVQDTKGFMWIGTKTGLVKYDGYRFKRYINDAYNERSIGGDYIKSLWAAPDGRVWIGTISDGVSVYDPNLDSFINYKHDENDPNSLVNDRVEVLLGDPSGLGIWLATNGGLDYLEYNTQKITHYQQDPTDPNSIANNHIRSLLYDKNQQLWVGHWQGISRFDRKTNTFFSVYSDPSDEYSLATDNVFKLIQSNDGTIWAGTTRRGLAWIKPDGSFNRALNIPQLKALADPWIFSIAQVPNGDVWVGTYGNGVYIVDEKTTQIKKHILPDITMSGSIHNEDVSDILVDKSGAIWLAFWGGLLNKYNPANDAFSFLRYSHLDKSKLTSPSKSGLHHFKNGELWVGSQGRGIDVLDNSLKVYKGFYPNSSRLNTKNVTSVLSIVQAEDDSIWLGTQDKGLQEYLPKKQVFQSYLDPDNVYNEYIHRVIADGQYIWLAASDGISRLHIKTKELVRFSSVEDTDNPISMDFRYITKQADGTLWAGSYNGLFMLPPNSSHFVPIRSDKNTTNALSHNHITGLLVDSKDNLWVSTIHGLNKLITKTEQSASFENINKRITNLPENSQELIEDNFGRFWNSLMMLNPHDWSYYELGLPESINLGMQSTGRLRKLPSGEILITGAMGVMRVKPNLFKPRIYQAPLVLNNLKIDGKSALLDFSKPLLLSADTQGFSLEFSALDFMSSNVIRYAYMLDGYNKNWVETDSEHRMVNYTNLDPGKYRLRVKVTNRQGVWSDNQRELVIQKTPAWYQTWLFKIFCVALIGFTFLAVYKIRLKNLKLQKVELTKQVAERTGNILLLTDIGKKLTSSLELDNITELLYSSLKKVLPADVFLLGILEEDKQRIVITKAIEYDQALPPKEISLHSKNSPAAYCVTQAKEVVMQADKEVLDFYQGKEPTIQEGGMMQSVIYQPLIVGKKVVGCLSIQNAHSNAFSEEQVDMIRTLASYTAIALTNALGYEQLEIAHENLNHVLKRLEEISFTDQLTGANNRHFLEEFMAKEIPHLKRENYDKGEDSQMGFLIIDADHFKKVNDKYGHAAGDLVLKQLVKILKNTCRESDLIVRWGGEEFLVAFRIKHKDQINVLAEKIRGNIDLFSFDIGCDKRIKMSCSIGMTKFPFIENNIDLLSWEQTLNIADLALYAAKANGRNAWVNLFENNVTDHENIYAEINDNLQALINAGVIGYKTNISSDRDDFFSNK